ncbi:hypothetical protein H4219_005384 [Mycoemilia scoparia]|uniref:Uncharacterized protein n=1 Tax=Mycoemilia scoparia TaxID=417184 RepID=A0A9W8DQ72_9FUNG|nr:hypothetical protein H4219_005384 [Mycoemilia scoparia]
MALCRPLLPQLLPQRSQRSSPLVGLSTTVATQNFVNYQAKQVTVQALLKPKELPNSVDEAKLDSSVMLSEKDSKPHHSESYNSLSPKRCKYCNVSVSFTEVGRARNALAEARQKLGKILGHDCVDETYDILESRVRLGLVDQVSVEVYANALAAETANTDSESDMSGETLVNGNESYKFRASGCSNCCYDIELLDDMYDMCWPLDPAEKAAVAEEARKSMPQVQIPPRYRGASLQPLATEQLMMKEGKIICPLKNRLARANTRRIAFEVALRERKEILEFRPQKSRLSQQIE